MLQCSPINNEQGDILLTQKTHLEEIDIINRLEHAIKGVQRVSANK